MRAPKIQRRMLAVLAGMLVIAGSNCASTARAEQPVGPGKPAAISNNKVPVATPAVTPEPVKAEPVLASKIEPRGDSASMRVMKAANLAKGAKIIVSTSQRQLWLINNNDTLLVAPVAIGMGKDFVYNGKKFHFATPTGRRKVLSKSEAPMWKVPEWHYLERASNDNLDIYYLKQGEKVMLQDSTYLEVRGKNVGRVNRFGNFWAFEPGLEIVFDGKLFVPPEDSDQREVPDALGPYKLDMGEGYLIHGTHHYDEDSIGDAVSHGCVRMNNFDLERLYFMVDPGTPVFIL